MPPDLPASTVRPIRADTAGVRSMLADAEPLRRVPSSPDPHQPRAGIPAGQWRSGANGLGLPPGCPVIPLGVVGSVGYFLDPIGQVQSIDQPYGKGALLGLFAGDANFLAWAWPRWAGKKKKEGEGMAIDGYAAEDAASDLMRAAFAKGVWRGIDVIRGRGVWQSDGGALVVHTGDKVAIGGKTLPPGEYDGHVYPARQRLPTPWPEPVEAADNPAAPLREMLGWWQWSRPHVDPQLFLGWLASSFIGGALAMRPTVYLSGDKAVGKSSLQELLKGVFGPWVLQTTDTTPAGIYQHLGADAVPVAIDEFEGKSDTRSAERVLELARASYSGGVMLRGGDRHNPVEFTARSTFLFSSINTPPLRPQDLSRMAILHLKRLDPTRARPDLNSRVLGMLGRKILRRMIDEWPRFDETLTAYTVALAEGTGMDTRGANNFGILLACADMIEHDGWDPARLSLPIDGDMVAWTSLMHISKMHEFEDQTENWRLCLQHLLSVRIEAWRSGNRMAVGQVIYDLYRDKDDMNDGLARMMLAQCGLGLVKKKGSYRDWWLAIPNQSSPVRDLFKDSQWAGAVGASVWAGALRQSPEGNVHRIEKQRINGTVTSCTLISLEGLYGDGGVMRIDEEG